MAKVVADYGVVHGLRRSAEERIRRDYDPTRDGGGPRGDVAREVVARKLHVPRAKKRDPDPREIYPELCGSTRVRIVLDRVAFHLVVADGVRLVSGEDQARTVVMNLISDEGTSASVDDVDTVCSS